MDSSSYSMKSHARLEKFKISAVVIILIIVSSSAASSITFTGAQAQALQLIVSAAQNSTFQNHFFGPQIVSVINSDPGATRPDSTTVGETVKGTELKRVHLKDGLWYSFIASSNEFFRLADVLSDGKQDSIIRVSPQAGDAAPVAGSTTHPTSIQKGGITFQIQLAPAGVTSFIREITTMGGNTFVEFNRSILMPTLPDPFSNTVAPSAGFNPDVSLNEPDEAANSVDWPYIQLIDIQETDQVPIRAGSASVTLTFAPLEETIQFTKDRTTYPVNAEIILGVTDFMWNINPVEDDVMSWILDKDTGVPKKVIYQPNRDFIANTNVTPDLLSILFKPNLGFDSRQILKVDTQGMESVKFIEAFNTATQTLEPTPSTFVSDNARFAKPDLAPPGASILGPNELPVISLIESSPNTSLFQSLDEAKGSRADIFAGVRDSVASFNYFEIVNSTPIAFQNGFVTVDKEIYHAGDLATLTVNDPNISLRSKVSEQLDGILSGAFVKIGNPFPLANNPTINTLPMDSSGNFLPNSVRSAVFTAGGAGTEKISIGGIGDFTSSGGTADLAPAKTTLLALNFTTSAIGASFPTGFVVNTAVTLADISDVFQFTMVKNKLTTKVDPFILSVSKFSPSLASAGDNDQIQVTFPKYNLIQVDISHIKLQSQFAKVAVQINATDSVNKVAQIIDFDPSTPSIDLLTGSSGFGSFKALDLINSAKATDPNLSNWKLKFTILFLNSANSPISMSSAQQQAIIDIMGLGVIRAEGATKDTITVDAFENAVYRLRLSEQGVSSSIFAARADFMTVLQSDTVRTITQVMVPIGDPIKIWLPGKFIPPNRLAFSYTGIDVSNNFRQVSATFIYETTSGKVSWDRDQYRFSQIAYLTVIDPDLNRDPDAIDQYSIPQDGFMFFEVGKQRVDTACQNLTPVPDGCFVKSVQLTLRETGPNTGIFVAQIKIPKEVLLENGQLFRTFQSDLQANYVDVRDDSSTMEKIGADAVVRSGIDTTQTVQPGQGTQAVRQTNASNAIIINIDRAVHYANETLKFTAKVPTIVPGIEVSVTLYSPQGRHSPTIHAIPNNDGIIYLQVPLQGKELGIWTIEISYASWSGEATFTLKEPKSVPSVQVSGGQNETALGSAPTSGLKADVKVLAKHVQDFLLIRLRNMDDSNAQIYAFKIESKDGIIEACKSANEKEWKVAKCAPNGTTFLSNNPFTPGERGYFLLKVDNENPILSWAVYNRDMHTLDGGLVKVLSKIFLISYYF